MAARKRPGICPVYQPRVQDYHAAQALLATTPEAKAKHEAEAKKKVGHIMLPVRPRCKSCPPLEKYKTTDRCNRVAHPNFSRCSGCGFEDRDSHYCDTFISRAQGLMSVYGFCDRKATAQRDGRTDYFNKEVPSPGSWLCTSHLPEKVRERIQTAERNQRFKFDAETESRRYGWVGKGYEAILLEMAGWMSKNRDLVETDEWLGKISEMMASNQQLLKVLGVTGSEEND